MTPEQRSEARKRCEAAFALANGNSWARWVLCHGLTDVPALFNDIDALEARLARVEGALRACRKLSEPSGSDWGNSEIVRLVDNTLKEQEGSNAGRN